MMDRNHENSWSRFSYKFGNPQAKEGWMTKKKRSIR